MLARVKLEQTLDFDAADKLVKEALAVNPKLAGAFAVRAGASRSATWTSTPPTRDRRRASRRTRTTSSS